MKIPKKISPDRIKDAIVEVRYATTLPFEVVIGIFFKALDDSYIYTNRPTTLDSLQDGIHIEVGAQNLFFNKSIKIQLQPNAIIFNCLNAYSSWSVYLPEITKVVEQLVTSGAIEEFQRAGVRYISEYPDIDLQSCINFAFSFGMPHITSKTYSFKSEFEYNENRVILNIHNKLPVLRSIKNVGEVQRLSQIDIDVIKLGFAIKAGEFHTLIDIIDNLHSTEKEIFFTLLNPQFLETLNPEY